MATKNFKAMNLNSMLMKADTVTSTPKVSSGLESLTKPVSMRKLAAFDTGIKKEETKISNVETAKVTQKNTPDQDAEEKKAAGPFIPLKTSPKAKRPKTAFINSARTKRTSCFQKKKEESESDESSRSSSSKSSSVESSKKSEAKKTPKPQLPKVAPGKGKNATANK